MKALIFIALVLAVSCDTLDGHHEINVPVKLTGFELKEGLYTFTDPVTGLNLAVEGDSLAEKAKIVLAKPSNSNSQKFLVKNVFDHVSVVVSVKSGLYLSVEENKVVQLPLTYTSEQQWFFPESPVKGNHYIEATLLKTQAVAPIAAGQPLGFKKQSFLKNGFKAVATTVNAADSHKIAKETIALLTYKPAAKLAAGTYYIGVVATTHDLDIVKTGKQILATPAAKTPSQQFKVEVNAEGLYRIVSVKLNEAVVTTGDKMDGGAEIDHAPIAAKDLKQWWNIVERGVGIYSIINVHSQEALSVPTNEHANQQYFVGNTQQLFTFKKI